MRSPLINVCAGVQSLQCRLKWGQCEVQCSGKQCRAANSSALVVLNVALMLDYCVDEGDL